MGWKYVYSGARRIGVRLRLAWVVAGLWGCWVVVSGAQAPIERRTPQDPVQTLTLQSRLVTVAVNAVDAKRGHPVAGLGKADFRLLEDGKGAEDRVL